MERLRENYTQQSDWIRENCAIQMERVRDNYNGQVQNLKDIRQMGSSHITAVRYQYFEQMNRIRDYSTSQLNRVHENYIFQRQRLRKFSAQNYLKIRETRQYTQKTVNKVMENLPALYLDLTTCRQGLGDRTESIVWDPDCLQVLELGKFHQGRLVRENGECDSLYFTPSGTPVRDSLPPRRAQSQKTTPVRDPNPYKAVYESNTVEENTPPSTVSTEVGGAINNHRKQRYRVKSKSFSNFLPIWRDNGGGTASSNNQNHSPSSNNINKTKVLIEKETSSEDYIEVTTELLDQKDLPSSTDENV